MWPTNVLPHLQGCTDELAVPSTPLTRTETPDDLSATYAWLRANNTNKSTEQTKPQEKALHTKAKPQCEPKTY